MENRDSSYITLRDLWELFIANFWLFVLSIAIAVSIAVFYIATTPPTFKRTTSILIKNNGNSSKSYGTAEQFSQMGLIQPQTDIGNEMHILSTPMLMERVVRKLKLNYNYHLKFKNLRWVDVYNTSPFIVELDDELMYSGVDFQLMTDGKTFELFELVVDGVEYGDMTGQYDTPIKVGAGSFTITKRDAEGYANAQNLYSFNKGNVEATARGLAGALTVERRDLNSSILDVSIVMGSTQKAEDLLNTLVAEYSNSWVADKNEVTISTTKFINERLTIIERELGNVDMNITNYKSENLLPDVGAVTSFNLQSTNESFRLQVELNNQLSMAQYLLEYIQSEISSEQLLPVNAGIEASSINEQIENYNQLLMRKNTLLAAGSEVNPIVAEMISDLDYSKRSLILSMNELINTLKLKISNAQEQEIQAQKRLSNNPSQELYLMSTGREQKIKEELYLFLLQKREENELNQAFTAYNTKVIGYAIGSKIPVAPQRNVILLFGLVIGAILPIVYLILKMSLDSAVRDKKDLEDLNIPVIGWLPRIEATDGSSMLSRLKSKLLKITGRANAEKLNIVVSEGGRDVGSESFRVVRTNLDFMIGEIEGAKVLQLISFISGSGKTYISKNLALSMALKDSKVLVIDCDIRKATFSKSIGDYSIGISSYLNGRVKSVEDIIIKECQHANMDVIPVGTIPPNPSELLLKARFAELISYVRERYDYIFLDCPPVEIVPDAAIVAKYCDLSIFVIRAGNLDKRLLPDIEVLAKSGKYKNMSLLLNGVVQSRSGYYGYGKYGYGKYGYGSYGYGVEEKK